MDGYQRDIDNKHIRISMFVCLFILRHLTDYLCRAQSCNIGG